MTQPEEHQIPEKEPGPSDELDFDDEDENFEEDEPSHSDCRCGECCRRLLIEVDLDDAEREPRIKEASPIYESPEFTKSGQKEVIGYLLNDFKADGYACRFLNESTNLCSIYDTRPWVCRVFDCDGEGKEQLIQLGYRPKEGPSR
jgi:Fe-S-cluster containining protein